MKLDNTELAPTVVGAIEDDDEDLGDSLFDDYDNEDLSAVISSRHSGTELYCVKDIESRDYLVAASILYTSGVGLEIEAGDF